VHLRARAGPRSEPAHRAARVGRPGSGWAGACDRAGARATLAGSAAGGFHDNLVTPRVAPGCVESAHRVPPARISPRTHAMTTNPRIDAPQPATRPAEVVREFGPFNGAAGVHGVS